MEWFYTINISFCQNHHCVEGERAVLSGVSLN